MRAGVAYHNFSARAGMMSRLSVDTIGKFGCLKKERSTSQFARQFARALASLREMILRGEFRPGERLLTVPLASRLGVSRTPRRLALERLAQEGILETGPGTALRSASSPSTISGTRSKPAPPWKARRPGWLRNDWRISANSIRRGG